MKCHEWAPPRQDNVRSIAPKSFQELLEEQDKEPEQVPCTETPPTNSQDKKDHISMSLCQTPYRILLEILCQCPNGSELLCIHSAQIFQKVLLTYIKKKKSTYSQRLMNKSVLGCCISSRQTHQHLILHI